jgi:ATP-dependent Clp protease ATP-binding subunit ClpC
MATLHYPVVVWPDAAGGWTAALVADYEDASARAGSEREALQQLKDLLEWRAEHEPLLADPELIDPELSMVRVEVRPQYQSERRILPSPQTVHLAVPCVVGRDPGGLPSCTVPHLGLQFGFTDPQSLRALVTHFVRERLQTLSPLQLAAKLPPGGCRLTRITTREVSHRARQVPWLDRAEYRGLRVLADPLLGDRSRRGAPSAAYGREMLSAKLARKLGRERASVLLVGETGVGKTTLLVDAVRRWLREGGASADSAEGTEEENHRAGRFWRGNGGRIIAGMRYLGEWEERCAKFIDQLRQVDGVFCAENLLELLQVGGRGAADSVGAFLLPYLQQGDLRMVAEATPAEVAACRRLLPGLLDPFQVFPVPEFSESEAMETLARIAHASATSAKIRVEIEAIPLVHRLHRRFIPYAAMPGPAAVFLRHLCDHASRRPAKGDLGVGDVVTLFTQQTGLPEIFLRDDRPLVLEDVRANLEARIKGQPDAVAAAARLVTTLKAGLNDPRRPLGVLLFCGPTGVGKTALARALADYCFGAGSEKDRLVRLDMSEYTGFNASTRLLHGPDGAPAWWIQRVRRQPFSLLLLDEIEKAAPEVFDVLLGVLDEGRLTDAFGRVTRFRSAIVILTSNLGSTVQGNLGFGTDGGPAYDAEVRGFFRPEFFNRLDAVIAFRPLSADDVLAITRQELETLATREGFAAAGLRLHWTEALVAAVARAGYDQRLGARPLLRAIERLVVTPLARWRVEHPTTREVDLMIDLNKSGEGPASVTQLDGQAPAN